ncbi:MAG: porin [Rhodospirillaceae bacterium]
MRASTRVFLSAAVAAVALSASVRPSAAQWQTESKDGQSSIKLGFLIQPQLELLETADQEATSSNLFIRRLRLLVGGAVGEHWAFFFETDSPNLGKANPNPGAALQGAKDQGDIYVQDAYVTYSQSMAFKVDAGMIMLPHSRNGTQSAATLLAVDYGPYTFIDSGPGAERVGRDYGVQLRGYPAGQKLEYRLAVSQGVRGDEARNPLRVTGRAVYYPFGAETGFFYAGTFRGTKRQAGFGGGFDVQEDATIWSADAFFDTPVLDGRQGLTVQLNWMRYDGGSFLPALPKQDAFLVEAGYHVWNHRLTPFVQYQARAFAATALPDQDAFQAGVAWWLAGHQRTLKFSVGRLHTRGQPGRTQMLVQFQLFYF